MFIHVYIDIYLLINGNALSSYLQMSFCVSRDESWAKDLGNGPRVAGCGISIRRMCGGCLFFAETPHKHVTENKRHRSPSKIQEKHGKK